MSEPKSQDWFLLVFISLIWGSSFILMKKGLTVYSPLEVASLRVFWAMIAMLPFLLSYNLKVSKSDLKYIAVIAFLGTGIPAILFATAQTKIPSALSGSLNALVPVFVFLWGVIAFGISFKWNKVIGLLTGIAGAFLLVSQTSSGSMDESHLGYAMLILLAGNCYALSANTLKNHCTHIHPIRLNLIAFTMLLPFAIVFLLWNGTFSTLQVEENWLPFFYLALLGVLATAIANIIFFRITQRTSALFSSTTTYIIPIVALGWGLLDGEKISSGHILGLILIVSGVYIINSKSAFTKKVKS